MGDGFARKKKEPPMDADERRQKIDKLTERIIGCAFTVGNVLGCGFLEKVYENALAHELRRNGLRVQQQHGISVCYDDVVVGEYVADLLVDDEVLVELKAVQSFDEIHTAQSLNYLNATGLHICLLVNFGKPKVEIRRLVRDF
jgi:GxxExxY protein